MKVTGVIVARFQTPFLHEGHRYLLNEITRKHNKVVIVLGVSPVKGTKRNPFDFYTREQMIRKDYPGLVVLPLADHPSDIVWSNELDRILTTTFPNESFILYGSRDSFISHYYGSIQTADLPEIGNHSASQIREGVSDKISNTEDFRLGINYACFNMYEKVYPTVDIALVQNKNQFVLLGRKPRQTGWRLPGGFVDPTDDSYESAARRELIEECGTIETGDMEYLGSAKIDDWRYRHESDKIISLLFKTEFLFGSPKASDDLEEVKWFAVDHLQNMIEQNSIVPEHHVLIEILLKNLNSQLANPRFVINNEIS